MILATTKQQLLDKKPWFVKAPLKAKKAQLYQT